MRIFQRIRGLYTRLEPDTTDSVLVGFFQDGLGDCWRGDDRDMVVGGFAGQG